MQTSCSRACNPVRPPPIWEFVNGSRDLLFRGVSSSNLSINNLLCGLEDLYFPLKCGFFRCYNLFHLSFGQILGNKSIGHVFLEVFVSHESKVYSDFVSHFTGSEKLWGDHLMLSSLHLLTYMAGLVKSCGVMISYAVYQPILCILSYCRFSVHSFRHIETRSFAALPCFSGYCKKYRT